MAKCKHHPGRAGAVKHGGMAYCEECKKQIESAAKSVAKHVSPSGCFVVYEGGKYGWLSFTQKSKSNTGCAHWVAHQKNIKRGAACLLGYTYRVKDLVKGLRLISDQKGIKVGSIWANDKLSHCGIVTAVKPAKSGDPQITIQHCSSNQGRVATNDWKKHFKGGGKFYK